MMTLRLLAMLPWLFCTLPIVAAPAIQPPAPNGMVLLEAEQFDSLGGWDLDQQSMDVMGSPYLLAHGLGVPVRDAKTKAMFHHGSYRIWVRTRDWVAPWHAQGAPGRFQVTINGTPLTTTFGTQGAAWHWQDGGVITMEDGVSTIALHDLTGFEGRCDAILFSPDSQFTPPNAGEPLAHFRRWILGIPEHPEEGGSYDFVVTGGGMAGTAAAISAARLGLRVALIQDRPVLGGNASSEVRVWPEGKTCLPPYPHIGDIVEQLAPKKSAGSGNARAGAAYADDRKLAVVKAEPNITLMLDRRVNAVEVKDSHITAVIAQDTRSGRRWRIAGTLFADCTGDASVGFLAGADFETSKESKMGASNLWNVFDASNPAELLKCECKDKDALTITMSMDPTVAPFPRCPWALDLKDKPFPGRANQHGQWQSSPIKNLGEWFWESGFNMDMIQDIEQIRDQNFRAMYGAWDTLKNVDGIYPKHRLGWVAFIAGKRESRRLLGDIILTADDFRNGVSYDDACFPCTWHIDIHTPDPKFSQGMGDHAFISRATEGTQFKYQGPYWAPYRTLYSRNIPNLLMAGRNISVTHEALGPVRVMRTTGMMGEIIGKAASICIAQKTTPRGVYAQHLPLLKQLMAPPQSPAEQPTIPKK